MPLIAVDWGTSSLRVARLDARGSVIEERSLPHGILSVAPSGFPAALRDACGDWMHARSGLTLISGMAGSRQGWLEAPYCPCPAGFADIASRLAWVEPGRIAIVPGLVCEHEGVPDVMRGEETQVFGALTLLGVNTAQLVLPGTHSKWVTARDGRIESFSTFMTGEFYALLRRHSILARTMPADEGELDEDAFRQGVAQALRSGNLLRSAFSARTLSLLDRLPEESLPSYLSGLVIGEEMRSSPTGDEPVVIVGSDALTHRYRLALKEIGRRSHAIGSQATWRGLWAIAQSLEVNA